MARVAEAIDRRFGWSHLPRPIALAVLIGIRTQLRAKNLHGTGRGPADRPPDSLATADYDAKTARTIAGTHNDLDDPLMGSTGSRFGRNVPVGRTHPDAPGDLLSPSPRTVSQRLLTRDRFRPATTLNVLAAAWIQFEVHDWVSHGTTDGDPWDIPLDERDQWADPPMTIKRTAPDPSPDGFGAPTFVTGDSHWWDASQIYGNTRAYADALRAGYMGKLRIDEQLLPPRDVEQLDDLSGNAGNSWLGLAAVHSLFLREHNAICDHLVAANPHLSDQQIYEKARLVNSALLAKIHTIDWTPAIIAHPTTVFAMRANWFGLLGERFARMFGRLTESELLQGIPGSPTNHHGVPYSLTEEFVAVYRMHPLIPDDYEFRSAADNRILATHELPDLTVRHIRDRLTEIPMDDVLYSLGRSHPGEITLHNFPVHLQAHQRADGSLIDLAAADVLRIRERGVPRYNEFRRLFRLKPAETFEELTDDPVWAEELRQVYGDVERVDLMIGLYAEKKPAGFGFSETAFRVFTLMASRRLSSDRFLTRDFRAEVYTDAGMQWVHANSMRTVLLRHSPSLEPALRGVANPFKQWTAVGSK
ncbi:MAG: peroxidase family protein [Mycobacterium sp.]